VSYVTKKKKKKGKNVIEGCERRRQCKEGIVGRRWRKKKKKKGVKMMATWNELLCAL